MNSPASAITREAARGTALVLVGAIAAQIAEYGYRLVMARGLGVEDFGTFNQARAVFLVLVVLAPMGLAAGMKRHVALWRDTQDAPKARRVIRETGRAVAVLALAFAGGLLAAAPWIAQLLGNSQLAAPLRVLACALPFAVGLDYVTRLGEALRSFRPTVVARHFLDPFLRLGLAIPLLAGGFCLTTVLFGTALAAALALVVSVILVGRLQALRSLPHSASPAVFGEVLRFSLPLMAGGVLFDLAERIDILMIGFFRDQAAVGEYSAASTTARSLLIFVASTMPVVATVAAEAVARGRKEDLANLQRTIARWMFLVMAPLATGLLLFPEQAIRVLFGDAYRGAASVMQILVIASLAASLTGPLGVLMDALGKTSLSLANMIVRTILNVVLNLFFIPRWGALGAAWATLISLVMSQGLFWWQLRTIVPIRAEAKSWILPGAILLGSTGIAIAIERTIAAFGFQDRAFPAVVAGGVLILVFVGGVRATPHCLEPQDLEVARALRNRIRDLAMGVKPQ